MLDSLCSILRGMLPNWKVSSLGCGVSVTRGLEVVSHWEWFEELGLDVLGSSGKQDCYYNTSACLPSRGGTSLMLFDP